MGTLAQPARLTRLVAGVRFRGRNWRYRAIFEVLGRHPLGEVLDVGGGSFAESSEVRSLQFAGWTVVDPHAAALAALDNARVSRVLGDGVRLPIRDDAFDTVLCIHVLEHVFEPISLMRELRRVTRPGGRIVVVAPQTANVHELPHHYQNFTRYWLEEAARQLDLEEATYVPLGGAWSTIASRLVFHYATALRVPGHHEPEARRGWRYWALAPLAFVVTCLVLPVALLLSAGDIEEEANNHLIVLRRPA